MTNDRTRSLLAIAAVAGGCAALLWRPVATFGALALTGAAGVLGVLVPLQAPRERSPSVGRWLGVVAVGVGAFAVARAFSLSATSPIWMPALVASVLAAIAEEAFFRRLFYGELLRWGPGVAILGSAAAFAAVHLPAYGAGVLPINLAAGILFGWQRWATGGWSAPAVSHVAANLLAMG